MAGAITDPLDSCLVECGGDLYFAVDFTSGGLPIGLRVETLENGELRFPELEGDLSSITLPGGAMSRRTAGCTIACHLETRSEGELIDRIRHDIQERLEQLVAEAEKLRRALAALDPREKPKPKSTLNSTRKRTAKPAERSAPAAASTPEPRSAAPRKRAPSTGKASPRARTAPGATKAKVLGALSADGAMTAGDVAKATGLARGTVSTTLTKLAKTGEISKAERGYPHRTSN